MESIEWIKRDDAATLERISRLVRELESETNGIIEPTKRDVVGDSVTALTEALARL